jgi:hypothetical protein
LEVQTVIFYSSQCIYRRRMCTYQYTVFTVLDTYGILYAGEKSDASVGSGSPMSIFRLIWISRVHSFVKHVRNGTAPFCFVFVIIDGYGFERIG